MIQSERRQLPLCEVLPHVDIDNQTTSNPVLEKLALEVLDPHLKTTLKCFFFLVDVLFITNAPQK